MTAETWTPDEAVCAECMASDFFETFIDQRAHARRCTFCGRTSDEPFAVNIEDIIDRVRRGVEWRWQDAAASVPVEGGEYIFRTYDSFEVVDQTELHFANPEVKRRIAGGLPDRAWVERNWQVGTRDEQLQDSWQRFSELVKHRNRYLFFTDDHDRRQWGTPPSQVLDEVGGMIRDRRLLFEIPEGTELIRVRFHDPDAEYTEVSELCSPPRDSAIYANRMSPAGVSAFYASFDTDIAINETDEGNRPAAISIGRWRIETPISVVDFVNLPDVPSLFSDLERRTERPVSLFLHGFVRSLTQPIEKDEREHIEYVPSQVVTEYLRDRFEDEDGRQPMGIRYPSSIATEGQSVVLFFTHRDFTTDFGVEPPLELVDVNHRRIRT